MKGMRFWTDNFEEFRSKVEEFFGPIEKLAKIAPDLYAHQVLSHGFMEYALSTNKYDGIQRAIINERAESGDSKYVSFKQLSEKGSIPSTMHSVVVNENRERFDTLLKREYYDWARTNHLEESLLEAGWEEYVND